MMNKLEGKAAILYRRVSTSEQKKHGHSLSEQKHRLLEFCDNNSIKVLKEFEEDYSAKDFNRPEFTKLVEFVKKNNKRIDYLLVPKWDRFSRNVSEALNYINFFESVGVEVNAIDEWIDYEDENQFLMLNLNLTMPEVENRRKSKKVIAGMRRALKEGRWINRQPLGYVKGIDEMGKPLMIPDANTAPLITELFSDFALGIYSQNELRNNPKYKELKLSKSNLSRLLMQFAYAGKIKVPAYKDEPEMIVDALHDPLISLEVFTKVQYYLNEKSRYNQKSKKLNPHLPLRGYLLCPRCGRNLTGSASKSKTGAKHYYYHCNPRKGCGERFKIKDAHDTFTQLLNEIQPNEEVCNLFELILEEKYMTAEESKYFQLKKVNSEIERLNKKQEVLTDKLLEGIVDNDTYKTTNRILDDSLIKLNQEKDNLNGYQKDIREFVKFGVYMLKNINQLFDKASTSIKQKLLSSILKKNWFFKMESIELQYIMKRLK